MAKKSTTKKAPARRTAPDAPRPLRLEYVQAGTLTLNPLNWRRHPAPQLDALRGVLQDPEVGWAGALTFNERTGRLVDGHGRLKVVPPEEFVPVLVGSWSDAAEKKILLSLDPIAGMAEASADALQSLRADVGLEADGFAGLRANLDQLFASAAPPAEKEFSPSPEGDQPRLDQRKPVKCPSCEHEFVPPKS